MEDVYESPKSNIEAENDVDKRPILVWIIFIFACIGTLGIASHFLMVSGVFPMDDVTANYYANLTILDNVLVVVGMVIGFVAALQLFRLKKNALHLMLVQLVLNVLFTIYNLNNSNYREFMEAINANIYLAIVPGAIFMVLYVGYTFYLYRRGTLK
ncbi:MAG: hypothetical protein HWE27_16345 [Gammaproteobacteria bacterium]|nr:hypothetical protein [Gammaproteobacteria bacterium]